MTYEQRIRRELERVVGTDEWLRLHYNPDDPEAFVVGVVAKLSSEAVLLHVFDSDGRDNGSQSVPIESVVGLTLGGEYVEGVRTLRDTLAPRQRLTPEDSSPEGTLRAAQVARLVVSVRLEDETIQGYVREVGEQWVAVSQIDDKGGDDGMRIVSLDALERVYVGGDDEMRLACLDRARRVRHSIG